MAMAIITETMTVIGRGTTVATTTGAIMVGVVVLAKNLFGLKVFHGHEVYRGFCRKDRSPSVVGSFKVKLHALKSVASR
jgi:hypothetical protein